MADLAFLFQPQGATMTEPDKPDICPDCGAPIWTTCQQYAHRVPYYRLACSRHPFEHFVDSEEFTGQGTVEIKVKEAKAKDHPAWRAWRKRHADCMEVCETIGEDGTRKIEALWRESWAKPAKPRKWKPKPKPKARAKPAMVTVEHRYNNYLSACKMIGKAAESLVAWRARMKLQELVN